MDFDIFKRKWNDRGYYFPKTEDKILLYKNFGIDNKEFTIYCVDNIEDKPSFSLYFYIDAFSAKSENKEIRIADIVCRSCDEINEVLCEIENLINGKNNEPFSKIIKNDKVIHIIKKKGKWILKQ